MVTTFLVGALSAINGVAASFAEEVPVLSLVSQMNFNKVKNSLCSWLVAAICAQDKPSP